MPTAHVSTASKPPVPHELSDDRRVRGEPVRPRVRTGRRLLREIGVERRLHPDPEDRGALDRDLVAGAVRDDRSLDVADVVPRYAV